MKYKILRKLECNKCGYTSYIKTKERKNKILICLTCGAVTKHINT